MSRVRLISLAAAGFALSTGVAFAQQQPPQNQGPTGEARIVQRQGPKIDVKQGARPVATVIFTNAQATQAQGEGLVISILESDAQNAANDREALFESKNALDGVVTHDFAAQGAGSQQKRGLIITAKRGAEAAQVEQIGSAGQNALVYAVRKVKPQAAQPAVAAAAEQPKPNEAEAQQAAARQAAEKQKLDEQQKQQAAQQAAQQQQQAEAAPAEENDAIIVVYLVGTTK